MEAPLLVQLLVSEFAEVASHTQLKTCPIADPNFRGTRRDSTPSSHRLLTPVSTDSMQLAQIILSGATITDILQLLAAGRSATALSQAGVSCLLALACRQLVPNLVCEPKRDSLILPSLPSVVSVASLSLFHKLISAGALPSLPWFTRVQHSAIGADATLVPLSAFVLNGVADAFPALLAQPGRTRTKDKVNEKDDFTGSNESAASRAASSTGKVFILPSVQDGSRSHQTRSNSTAPRHPASPSALAALRVLSGQTADTEGLASPKGYQASQASYGCAMGPIFLNGYVIFGVPFASDIPRDLDLQPIRLLTLDDAGYLGRSSDGSKSGRNSAKAATAPDAAKSLQQAVGTHAQMYAGEHTIHALHPMLLASFCGSTDAVCQMTHLGARCDLAVAYPATVSRWGAALVAEHSVNMRALGALGAQLSAQRGDQTDSSAASASSLAGRAKGVSKLAAVAEAASKEKASSHMSRPEALSVAQNSRDLSANFASSPNARQRRLSGESEEQSVSGFYDAKLRDSTLSDARSAVSEHTIDPFSHEVRGGFKAAPQWKTAGAGAGAGAGSSSDSAAAAQLMAGADSVSRASWKKSGMTDAQTDTGLNSARSTATVGQGWTLPHGKRNLVPAGCRLSHIAAKSGNVLSVCLDFSDCLLRAAAEAIVLEASPSEVNRLLPTVEIPRPSAAPACSLPNELAVLSTVMGGTAISDAMQPHERLHACRPPFMWSNKEALDNCLPPIAMLLSSGSPGVHAHASLSPDFWTSIRLSRLQQLVTVALDAITVRSLLQAAGAFVQWRTAAATSMRNSPFATEHILFPEAGHRDRGVRHVLLRLSQHAQQRSVTQQTPLHTLTRCITPRPAEHVLHAYCTEDEHPQVQLPPRVPSQLSSPGTDEPGDKVPLQRVPSHHSSRSGGYRNMPSSASEVFGTQNTLYRPRTVLDFWRESDTYVSQISTEGSSHLGRKADAWRHARATAEAEWGWGDLAGLEKGSVSSFSPRGGRNRATQPPEWATGSSGSAGKSATNTVGRTLPHDNHAAELSGLCLASISQVSLALSSFAEGGARGYAAQLGVPEHSISPARFLVLPALIAPGAPAFTDSSGSGSGSVSQHTEDYHSSEERQLDLTLRENFFAPLEAKYMPPSVGTSALLPNKTGQAAHRSSVAKGETGYAIDMVCALLRSTTALHMRRTVRQCTGRLLPLTCAGGVSAAALSAARPSPLQATASEHLATVAADSFEEGGLPVYAQVGYRCAARLGEEGTIRSGTALLPPGTVQATQLHSAVGVGTLLLAAAVSIPEEACAATSSELAALSKLLFSSMGMQQTAEKLSRQQQERQTGIAHMDRPGNSSSPLAASGQRTTLGHGLSEPARLNPQPKAHSPVRAPDKRLVSNHNSQLSTGSDVLRADALTALESGSAMTNNYSGILRAASDGMSALGSPSMPVAFGQGQALNPQHPTERITLASNGAGAQRGASHENRALPSLHVTLSSSQGAVNGTVQSPGGGSPAGRDEALNPTQGTGGSAQLPVSTAPAMVSAQGGWKLTTTSPLSSSQSGVSSATGEKPRPAAVSATQTAQHARAAVSSAPYGFREHISVSLPTDEPDTTPLRGVSAGAGSPPIPRAPFSQGGATGSPPVASPPAARGRKGKAKKRPGLKLQLGSARGASKSGTDRGIQLAAGSSSSEEGARQLQQLAELQGHTMAGYSVGVKPGGPAVLLTPTKLRQLADDNRSHASWDLSSTGTRDRGEDAPPGGGSLSLRAGSFRRSDSGRVQAPLLHSDGSGPGRGGGGGGGVAMTASLARRSGNFSPEQLSGADVKYGMYQGTYQRLPGSSRGNGSVMSGLSED